MAKVVHMIPGWTPEATAFLLERGINNPKPYSFFAATKEQIAVAAGFDARVGGIGIPHMDELGNPIPLDGGGGIFTLYRRLPWYMPKGKYVSPLGSRSHAWLDPTIEWAEVFSNPRYSIGIVEGAFKAACANRLVESSGVYWISISGVDNWSGRSYGMTMLPELMRVKWPKRKVYICYDADLHEKESVMGAMCRLASRLRPLKAELVCLDLRGAGGTSGGKGLDDYLMHGSKTGDPSGERMLKLLKTSPITLPATELDAYIVRYITIRHQRGMVYDLENGSLHTLQELRSTLLAHERTEDGETTLITALMNYPYKVVAENFTFRPDQMPGVVSDGERLWINTWTGFPIEKAVDAIYNSPDGRLVVKVWTDICSLVLNTLEEGDLSGHVHDWVAHIFQRPWEKVLWGIMVHGVVMGTGKSFIPDVIKRMMGPLGKDTPRDMLVNPNSSVDGDERLIFSKTDEIDKTEKYHVSALKGLITDEERKIRYLFKQPYTIPNLVRRWFTSNEAAMILIEEQDRRWLVIEVSRDIEPQMPNPYNWGPEGTYEDAMIYANKLLKGAIGQMVLYRWYMERDISAFDSSKAPIKTESLKDMATEGHGIVGDVVYDMMSALGDPILFKRSDLQQYLENKRWGRYFNPVYALLREKFKVLRSGVVYAMEGGKSTTVRVVIATNDLTYGRKGVKEMISVDKNTATDMLKASRNWFMGVGGDGRY